MQCFILRYDLLLLPTFFIMWTIIKNVHRGFMNTDIEKYKVYKSNHLVEASYRLNLEEQRLVLACISQVDSRIDEHQAIIRVNANDYAATYNLDLKNAYQQLKSASDKLYERDIKLRDPSSGTVTRMRWVSSVKYQKSQGFVILTFSAEIKEYLFSLSGRFTSYRIRDVASLKSIYSIRIYELLIQYRGMNKAGRIINLVDFRNMLDITDKYSKFSDLRKRVLEPSMKELNQCTDLSISYEPIKQGRTIVAIAFIGQEKPQQSMNTINLL